MIGPVRAIEANDEHSSTALDRVIRSHRNLLRVPSNFACLGLNVHDQAALHDLLETVLAGSTVVGQVGDVEVRRWDDPSGARLVLGVREGEITDLVPSFAGEPGVRLADCVPLNSGVASADVLDEDGEQLTALAVELEQRHHLPRAAPVTGLATVVALGNDVAVYRDEQAFTESPASLLGPGEVPSDEAPVHVAPDSFLSYGIFESPADALALARMAGVVLRAERRCVELTGQCFVTARVRNLIGELDVCLDDTSVADLPQPGEIIAGRVYLAASFESLPYGDEPQGYR